MAEHNGLRSLTVIPLHGMRTRQQTITKKGNPFGPRPTPGLYAMREFKERNQDANERLKNAEENLGAAEKHAGVLKAQHEATERQIESLESEITARKEITQKLIQEAADTLFWRN
jgi:hypothetical protein